MSNKFSPTSMRMPDALKKKVASAAERAHQSVSDFIITALEMRLAGACEGCGRDYSAERLKERIVELAGLLAKVEGRK